MSVVRAPARLARGLLAVCLALAGVFVLAAPALAAAPMLDVTCTAQVAYGSEIDCTAATVDALGNYAAPGTFTFDPGHVLPVTWDHATCAGTSSCQVAGQVAVVPNASAQTLVFSVQFTAADSSRVSKTETVALTLVPTVTTLTCDTVDVWLAGSTHCLVSVVDEPYDGAPLTPAVLPPHVAGMAVTSSDPADVVTYDAPSSTGSTCVAAVVDQALQCGLTVRLDAVHGLHTLSAAYVGNPATDEVASTGTAVLSDGPRATPTVVLACPSSVPALQPQTTCQVTVVPLAAGDPPTGTVTLDQSAGDVPPDAPSCTLTAGSCSIAFELFEGTVQLTPPPVRATYSGDGNYLPATASQQIAVVPTPTTTTLTCDSTSVPVASSVHCSFVLSSPDGRPVPVGPSDLVLVTTTAGVVVCDVPADLGCGHVDTTAATVVGFTLRAGATAGTQLVSAQYSGDPYDQAAPASQALTITTLPASGGGPPVIGVGKVPTRTTVHCSTSVAYLHPMSCLVTVSATGAVPSGTVTFTDPATSRPPFTVRTCTLSAKGQCTVELTPSLRPTARLSVAASYEGSSGFQPSTAQAGVLVRNVATAVTISCAHTAVATGAGVHCTATVRTEFGGAPGAPTTSPSEATFTARGDRITYDHGRACHWKVSGHTLTCGFTVTVVKSTTVHVYYRGSAKAHDAASRGTTTIKATRAS